MTDVTIHPPPVPLQALLSALDQTRLQHDLDRLCITDFAGRRIGTDGHDRAAAWLRTTMEQLGLIVESFAFTLDQPVLDLAAAPTLAIVDAREAARQFLAHRRDFAEHPASGNCLQPTAGPARRWNTDADVSDAWIILETVPPADTLIALGEQLMRRGAAGILLPQQPTVDGYLVKRVTAVAPVALPVIVIRDDLLDALVGQRIYAHVPIQRQAARGQHILGYMPGTDDALTQAPLIVGAHYDGVGDDSGGFRIPGAADNAAGVAVMLEVARVVQRSPIRPRRPIIFAAFDGEEVQAQGSRAHAQQLRDTGSAPLVINLDGAARLPESVWVEASAEAHALLAALDQAGQWLELPLVFGQVASDNRRYAAAGFPAVGVALGGSGGHTPNDIANRVDLAAMQLAAKLLMATMWQLAF